MEHASAAPDIAELTARAARVLAQAAGAQAALRDVIHLAVETSSWDFASVTVLAPGRHPHPIAVSDPLARWLDAVQCDSGQGPIMDVLEEGSTCDSPDLTLESRWSRFSPLAVDRGIRSVVACRLSHPEDASLALGSLNLYARQPGGLGGGTSRPSATFVRAADLITIPREPSDPGSQIGPIGPSGVSVTSDAFGDRTVLRVAGEIDRATMSSLRRHLDDLLATGTRHLEIDLSGVTFFGTDGARLLLETHQRVTTLHRHLALTSPSASVQRVVELTGVGQVLAVDEGR